MFKDEMENPVLNPGEAIYVAKEKFEKEMEECEKIHASIFHEKFYEMSKECK